MTIKVTEAHIAAGIPYDPCECPIALAIREIYPRRRVEVGLSGLHIGTEPRPLPEKVRRFIKRFDKNPLGKMRGFTFEL